jgi:hypothetical protein
VEGHNFKTDAVEAGVSPSTIAWYMRRIDEKLHAHSKSEAVAKAPPRPGGLTVKPSVKIVPPSNRVGGPPIFLDIPLCTDGDRRRKLP